MKPPSRSSRPQRFDNQWAGMTIVVGVPCVVTACLVLAYGDAFHFRSEPAPGSPSVTARHVGTLAGEFRNGYAPVPQRTSPDNASLSSSSDTPLSAPAKPGLIRGYIEWLTQTDQAKLVLYERALALVPRLQEVFSRGASRSISANADAERDVSEGAPATRADVSPYVASVLPTRDWDQLADTVRHHPCPSICQDLRDHYMEHIRSLQNLLVVATESLATSPPASTPGDQDSAERDVALARAQLEVDTNAAEAALTKVDLLTNLPTNFVIAVPDTLR